MRSCLFVAASLLLTFANPLRFKGDPIDIKSPEGKKLLATIASPHNPRFPRPLTPIAAQIYRHAVANALQYPAQAPISADLMAGSAKLIKQVTQYGNIDSHCKEIHVPAMLEAKEEILIAMYLYDWETACARHIVTTIRDLDKKLHSSKKKLRVWFVISTVSMLDYGRHSWQTRWQFSNIFTQREEIDPRRFALPDPSSLKHIDLRVKTYHQFVLGALHTKILVIDGRRVITGSKNLDAETAHEYVYMLEGSAAMSARADFENVWAEGTLPKLGNPITKPRRGDFPTVYLGRTEDAVFFDHQEDNPQDQAWIGGFKLAKKSIYVETPNFVTQTIVDAAIDAVLRGVHVTIVTSFYMSDEAEMIYENSYKTAPLMAAHVYEVLASKKAATKRMTICWFIGKRVHPAKPSTEEWTHVKAMIIDDAIAIVGTGNQDPQTWYHSREDNFMIDDKSTARKIKASLLKDQQSLQHCFHGAH